MLIILIAIWNYYTFLIAGNLSILINLNFPMCVFVYTYVYMLMYVMVYVPVCVLICVEAKGNCSSGSVFHGFEATVFL